MWGNVTSFSVPKNGAKDGENEDAYSIGPILLLDGGDVPPRATRLRLAVADGATESSFSGKWARLLAKSVAQSSASGDGWALSVVAAVLEWRLEHRDYAQRRSEAGIPVMWFEEHKLQRGSHATLVAITLESISESNHGSWAAIAIGDACLFQVRDDNLVVSFPINDPRSFDSEPHLVNTMAKRSDIMEVVANVSGDWQSGDSFYLCTDAVASWFLNQHSSGLSPWRQLKDLDTEGNPSFQRWVEDERNEGRMRNDDVTLVRADCF